MHQVEATVKMCEYAARVCHAGPSSIQVYKLVVFGLIKTRTKKRLLCKEQFDLVTAVAIAHQAESWTTDWINESQYSHWDQRH